MSPRRAVLFDLFDTLVRFDRERLPLVQVNGRTVRSTAGTLHAVFQPLAPHVALPQFVDALLWSWQEAERLRAVDHREVAAPERFELLFRRLGLDPAAIPSDAVHELLHTHGRELARASEFPPHHGSLLRRLAGAYQLAVVSNFDYTPTARRILDAAGVTELFRTIVVSDEIGWRKPKALIFEEACRRLSIRPADALFVGDRADIDVVGAQGIGMPVAWINPASDPLPPGITPPDFEIRDLAELEEILARAS